MMIAGIQTLTTIGKQLARTLTAIALVVAIANESFAVLRHSYLFNAGDGTTVVDSVPGGLNGTAVGGTIDIADSRFVLDGVDNYVDFDGASLAINTYSAVTLELWSLVSPVHEGQYTATVAFGGTDANGNGINYIMMQPTRGGAEGSSGQIIDVGGGGESRVNTMQDLSDGRIHHTVLTISGTEVAYYVDGVQIGTSPLDAPSLAGVSTQRALLGDSVWNGDPFLNGALYEFRIYDDVKSPTDVTNLFNAGCLAGCGNMFLEIDRDTGAATLVNGLSAKDVVIFNIASAKGALNTTGWLSITENYDQDNGSEFDDDDVWEIVTETKTVLREQDPISSGANDGGVFDDDVPLGNIWTQSPFEDLQVTITILDENFVEQQLSVPVFYINGFNDAPFRRSDFDLDDDIDADDYATLQANHLQNLGGTLHIDTFALGDINGDLVNDYRDFRLFKADYIAANGAGAFARIISGVPEPGTLGLMMLGIAASALTARRKRGDGDRRLFEQRRYFADNRRTMHRVSTFAIMIALLMAVPSVASAQIVVASENFDSYPTGDIGASGLPGARHFTCCNATAGSNFANLMTPGVGGSGNLVQAGAQQNPGGFSLGGFGFDMTPSGNFSPNRADYNLEFDMQLVAGEAFTGGLDFFITIVDAPVFGGAQAHGSVWNVTAVDALVVGGGFQHITLNLGNPTATFFNRPAHWMPIDPNNDPPISLEFNAQGGPAATVTQIYEIDNVELVLDIAPSLALVVDPTSGKARVRNVSGADLTFDYYRIESTNGSLLTANFNGTTGWSSLDDQGIDSIGAGTGESWDEVTAASSANRLVEQFLLGGTTLAAGQSVSLGAPVNPAILNSQLNTLSFRLGGPDYDAEAFGSVIFEDLSGLLGDFNEDDKVDAADYVVWRKNGTNPLPNDNGLTTAAARFNLWRANFGNTPGSGASLDPGNVPEPCTGCLVALVIAAVVGQRHVMRLARGRRLEAYRKEILRGRGARPVTDFADLHPLAFDAFDVSSIPQFWMDSHASQKRLHIG
jgi:hypothetical protein